MLFSVKSTSQIHILRSVNNHFVTLQIPIKALQICKFCNIFLLETGLTCVALCHPEEVTATVAMAPVGMATYLEDLWHQYVVVVMACLVRVL